MERIRLTARGAAAHVSLVLIARSPRDEPEATAATSIVLFIGGSEHGELNVMENNTVDHVKSTCHEV